MTVCVLPTSMQTSIIRHLFHAIRHLFHAIRHLFHAIRHLSPGDPTVVDAPSDLFAGPVNPAAPNPHDRYPNSRITLWGVNGDESAES